MFQQRSQTADTDAFWRKTEEEIGERVRATALTRCMSGCIEGNEPLWGILFLTSSSLYFRHFAQQNWFSALTAAVSGGTGEPTGVYFSISRREIGSADIRREGGRIARIFAYRPPTLIVIHAPGGTATTELQFTLDTNVREIAGELGISL